MKNEKIKLFISDVDGTLTDGSFYYSSEGVFLKKFNTRDGMGFELLKSNGIKTALITGEVDPINHSRAKKMGVDYFYEGKSAEGKLEVLKDLCAVMKIDPMEVAYIGDDINCLKILNSVGYKACPKDATERVLSVHGIHALKTKGGHGAIREYVDYLIDKNLLFNFF